MTTNREGIYVNIQTSLELITIGGGYNSTVALVEKKYKTFNEMDAAVLPWLGIVPQKNITPIYEPFNQIQKKERVAIIGHVAGTTPETKLAASSDLEQDVRDALAVDPTRGGWAVDTIEAEDIDSDEAAQGKTGTLGDTSSFVVVIECLYYPND